MFGREKAPVPLERIEVTIGPTASIHGDLVCDGIVKIDGIFQGSIKTPSNVIVSEKGRMDAHVEAQNVSVSGQAKGTFATFHSDSAQECLSRLALLGAHPSDMSSIDAVVVCRRIPQFDAGSGVSREVRAVTEISEVADDCGKPVATPLFIRDFRSGRLRFCGLGQGRLRRKLAACMPGLEPEEELARLERAYGQEERDGPKAGEKK